MYLENKVLGNYNPDQERQDPANTHHPYKDPFLFTLPFQPLLSGDPIVTYGNHFFTFTYNFIACVPVLVSYCCCSEWPHTWGFKKI